MPGSVIDHEMVALRTCSDEKTRQPSAHHSWAVNDDAIAVREQPWSAISWVLLAAVALVLTPRFEKRGKVLRITSTMPCEGSPSATRW